MFEKGERFRAAMSAVASGLIVGATFCAGGCATLDAYATGETHRLNGAPYYVDIVRERRAAEPLLVLPATLSAELEMSFEYAGRLATFAPILAAVNARLAALVPCCVHAGLGAWPQGAPRLYVGSAAADNAPPSAEQEILAHDQFAPMVLHLERPRTGWRTALGELSEAHGGAWVLSIELGVVQYPKRRAGTFGKKVVLGTGHEQRLRFLTAEDKPVEVLQLAGMLIDPSGRVVRAGAEGIIARDTAFMRQAFDVVELIDDLDLTSVLTDARRDDLPGSPLKWEVALDVLVQQLTAPVLR
jgi:hypothetical protein